MSIYTITTELQCCVCGSHSGDDGAAVVSGEKAEKLRTQKAAKEAGWYVHGRGEWAVCPCCRRKPEAPGHSRIIGS